MNANPKPWPTSRAKRLYDLALAGCGLVLLGPFLLLLGLLVKGADGGPVFYRQQRIGLRGKPFAILKFRTMVLHADKMGPSLTRGDDRRITPLGRWLRKTKLDELPQLWNVLKGEMTLVGPRPEVPRYVEKYSDDQRPVLELPPGITDLASLAFRNEEQLLQKAPDLETFYVQTCLPRKIQLNLEYARRAGPWEDTKIILKTLLGRQAADTAMVAPPANTT